MMPRSNEVGICHTFDFLIAFIKIWKCMRNGIHCPYRLLHRAMHAITEAATYSSSSLTVISLLEAIVCNYCMYLASKIA